MFNINKDNNIYIQIYKIFDIFKSNINIQELILNTLFIILIFIITLIIYWDNINSDVARTSRCKKQLDLSSQNKNIYNIKATDKNNEPLYNISYDTSQYNTNVECSCNTGSYINTFSKIPVRNIKNNTNTYIDKTCSCNKYYDLGFKNEKIQYTGEPGIIRYMKNTENVDFFDQIVYSPYN